LCIYGAVIEAKESSPIESYEVGCLRECRSFDLQCFTDLISVMSSYYQNFLLLKKKWWRWITYFYN